MFTKLTEKQLNNKIKYINQYIDAENAATGSKFNANSNVTMKNVTTLQGSLYEDFGIQLHRKTTYNKIEEMFDKELAEQYLKDLEEHRIYVHDETNPIFGYCASISIFPMVTEGLKSLGGMSNAPKNIFSFIDQLCSTIYLVSAQIAGAVGVPEALVYADYYFRKSFGEDYHENELTKQLLQGLVYKLNEPSGARSYQSPFTNFLIYDKYYFEAVFGQMVYPDFTQPVWSSINKLQKLFVETLDKERDNGIITFPVVTFSMLTENGSPKDKEYHEYAAQQLNKGNSFFIYLSDNPDSISSCCRLANKTNFKEFANSSGVGGVKVGSVGVITIDFNRLYQTMNEQEIKEQIKRVHKYLAARRAFIAELDDKGMIPIYKTGYIEIDKLYSTVGLGGLVEAAEYLGYTPVHKDESYMNFMENVLMMVEDLNSEAQEHFGFKINAEQAPLESAGYKLAQWAKEDGLKVTRDVYTSYMYVPSDNTNFMDKLIAHGKRLTSKTSGGSAAHINLEDLLTEQQYYAIIEASAQLGVPYFCFNTKMTICNDCAHIERTTERYCKKCGSSDVSGATRVVGYLKRVDNFSAARQQEESTRYYAK
ncbi:MAG: anaerobic ribonucleoside-triphosphate reductase [Bacteroidales bacterium]